MIENSYWTIVLIGLTPFILWAAWIDYKEKRVPNYLNLIIAFTGLGVQILYSGWQGLINGIEGLALGLGLLILPWMMYMMGAGDVKLLAAIGAWVGPNVVLWSFVIGAIIGGVVSVVMISYRKRWSTAIENFHIAALKCTNRRLAFSDVGAVKSLGAKAQLIPYGVPLTFGTIFVVLLKFTGLW